MYSTFIILPILHERYYQVFHYFQINTFQSKWKKCLQFVERIVILQEKYHAASIMLLFTFCLFNDILSNAGKMGLS